LARESVFQLSDRRRAVLKVNMILGIE